MLRTVEIMRYITPERSHWLTTAGSTLIQPGPLHAGVTDAPEATFEHLHGVLVRR